MKAFGFALAWLMVGLWVASRTARPPVERALAAVFWPFFALGQAPSTEPLDRLRSALGAHDAAGSVVDELARAISALRARLERLDGALADQSLRAEARTQLEEGRIRCRQELETALSAVDETASRLLLLRDEEAQAEVGRLLQALRARVGAEEEVHAGPR